jgi:hypothetical protein
MSRSALSFSGFSSPNYTMVPDQLFDELMHTLSGAELKVLLYIIRRTFGFKKEYDAISLSQIAGGIRTRDGRVLDRGTGLSKSTVAEAVKTLEAKGAVIRNRRTSATNGDEPTTYSLNLAPKPQSQPVSENRTPSPRPKIGHPPVRKSDTQETVIQNTDISNIRKEELVVETDVKTDDLYAETTIVLEMEEEAVVQESPNTTQVPRTASSPQPVGEVVARRIQKAGEQGGTARDAIMTRIAQFAEEFSDRATLKSSTSRAYNLFRQTKMSVEQFVNCLWEARAITRERLSTGRGERVRNKMSYFFSVLSERLGLQGANSATA